MKPAPGKIRKKRYWLHRDLENLWKTIELQIMWITEQTGVAHIGQMTEAQLDQLRKAVNNLRLNPWRTAVFGVKVELEVFLKSQLRVLEFEIKRLRK